MGPYEARIDAAYLANCSPEAAYAWLQQRAQSLGTGDQRRGRYFLTVGEERASNVLEWILFRRNHRLIDLGIARFGRSPAIVRRAFTRGNVGIRCGAWANSIVTPHKLLADSWYTPSDLERLVERAPLAEITAFASNPAIGDDTLVALIQRSGTFAKSSDACYRHALVTLGENPRLAKHYDDARPMDGWAEYQHGRAFDAAWGLTISLPATQHWAHVLHSLLRNCVEPSLFKEVDTAIARWRIDKNEWDASYYLRSRLADLKPADQVLLASDDAALRDSFYRRFSPWEFKEWPSFIERDGEMFVDAALFNKRLWQSKDERQRLERLCWDAPDEHHSLRLPNAFRGREQGLRARHPEWFRDHEQVDDNKDQLLFRSIAKKIDDAAKNTEQQISQLAHIVASAQGSRDSEFGQWHNVSAKITRQIEAIVQRREQKTQHVERKVDELVNKLGLAAEEIKLFAQRSAKTSRLAHGLLWFVGGVIVALILRPYL